MSSIMFSMFDAHVVAHVCCSHSQQVQKSDKFWGKWQMAHSFSCQAGAQPPAVPVLVSNDLQTVFGQISTLALTWHSHTGVQAPAEPVLVSKDLQTGFKVKLLTWHSHVRGWTPCYSYVTFGMCAEIVDAPSFRVLGLEWIQSNRGTPDFTYP